MQHWKEGGHDKLCKAIKKAGGAEVYNANKKYTEAVAVAAEMRGGHEGPDATSARRPCIGRRRRASCAGACRGTAGFAHVSCLAEQAKILVAEAMENNLGFGGV